MHDSGGPCFGKERRKANFPSSCSWAERRMHTACPNRLACYVKTPSFHNPKMLLRKLGFKMSEFPLLKKRGQTWKLRSWLSRNALKALPPRGSVDHQIELLPGVKPQAGLVWRPRNFQNWRSSWISFLSRASLSPLKHRSEHRCYSRRRKTGACACV